MSQPRAHHDGARFASMLTAAGVQARAHRRRVLVCLCERVPTLDPLVPAGAEHGL